MMYGSWDINWIFGHFVLFFALLPSNKMKNQNFEKLKKTPGDIIILHMSTINENYMICGSWDMECDRQIFFSFWTIFWLFYTPIITQRIKILKNWKKNTWKYHHFTQLYEKSWSHAILFLRYGLLRTYMLIFILGYFLAFFAP